MSALQPLIEQGFPAHLAEQITAEILDQYGEEPCTREQAAAHEAGHWVVGDTLGLAPYRWLRVFRERGKWLGENIEVSPVSANIFEDPDRYRVTALQVIAGFIGEAAAGHFHPSSSIDERIRLEASCAGLSQLYGGRPEALLAGAMVTVAEIIQARQDDFYLVRRHLERERRILRPRLDALSRPNRDTWLLRWDRLSHGIEQRGRRLGHG